MADTTCVPLPVRFPVEPNVAADLGSQLTAFLNHLPPLWGNHNHCEICKTAQHAQLVDRRAATDDGRDRTLGGRRHLDRQPRFGR